MFHTRITRSRYVSFVDLHATLCVTFHGMIVWLLFSIASSFGWLSIIYSPSQRFLATHGDIRTILGCVQLLSADCICNTHIVFISTLYYFGRCSPLEWYFNLRMFVNVGMQCAILPGSPSSCQAQIYSSYHFVTHVRGSCKLRCSCNDDNCLTPLVWSLMRHNRCLRHVWSSL